MKFTHAARTATVLTLATLVLAATFTAAAGPVLADVGRNDIVRNPNRITAEELGALPHMDTPMAELIVAGGPYLTNQALDLALSQVMTPEQRAELRGALFVPLNLNGASREEILLVPGVGDRMAHEFEEYRPYKSIAQFRREIGKYVDDDELARLEQFVFVPIELNTASDEDILTIPGVGKRMLHEFKEYRPYQNLDQFRREIGKYVDDAELDRLTRYVTLAAAPDAADAPGATSK